MRQLISFLRRTALPTPVVSALGVALMAQGAAVSPDSTQNLVKDIFPGAEESIPL